MFARVNLEPSREAEKRWQLRLLLLLMTTIFLMLGLLALTMLILFDMCFLQMSSVFYQTWLMVQGVPRIV